eukprot:3038049-Amphidinium_carterae.1
MGGSEYQPERMAIDTGFGEFLEHRGGNQSFLSHTPKGPRHAIPRGPTTPLQHRNHVRRPKRPSE